MPGLPDGGEVPDGGAAAQCVPADCIPGYYDVALRDLGLALGAFALARLAIEFDSLR